MAAEAEAGVIVPDSHRVPCCNAADRQEGATGWRAIQGISRIIKSGWNRPRSGLERTDRGTGGDTQVCVAAHRRWRAS